MDLTTLALWVQRNCIERIDGLWLDMQGHELTALMAAGEVLDITRAIILEVFAVELYEGAPLWPEVRDWLEAAGFRVKAESWHETGADGDVLAIRARR